MFIVPEHAGKIDQVNVFNGCGAGWRMGKS
jgi:hypothetical protein